MKIHHPQYMKMMKILMLVGLEQEMKISIRQNLNLKHLTLFRMFAMNFIFQLKLQSQLGLTDS